MGVKCPPGTFRVRIQYEPESMDQVHPPLSGVVVTQPYTGSSYFPLRSSLSTECVSIFETWNTVPYGKTPMAHMLYCTVK